MLTTADTKLQQEPDYDRLFEPYRQYLEGIAIRHFHLCADDAKDLAQATLLTAYEGRGAFDLMRSQKVKGYLYRMMAHRFYNILRARKRKPELSLHEEACEASLIAGKAEPLHGRYPQPDEELLAKSIHEDIKSALKNLSEVERHAFLSAVLDGCDYQEIAEEACVPIGTIRSRIFSARIKLRNALSSYDDLSLI